MEHRSPIPHQESLRFPLPPHPTLPDAGAPGSCSRGVDIAVRTEEAEFDKLVKGSGRLLACVKPLDFSRKAGISRTERTGAGQLSPHEATCLVGGSL